MDHLQKCMFFITMLSLQILCQPKSIVVSFANEETDVMLMFPLMWPFSGSALKSLLSNFEFHALPIPHMLSIFPKLLPFHLWVQNGMKEKSP